MMEHTSSHTFGDWLEHIDFPEIFGKVSEITFGDDGHTYYKLDNFLDSELKSIMIREDLVKQIEKPKINGFKRS